MTGRASGSPRGRLFNRGDSTVAAGEIDALCHSHSQLAHTALAGIWADPQFVLDYGRWTIGVLEDQRQYHLRVRERQHALLHRVHRINTWLFGMTGLAALAHLLIHSRVLTLITTFLPALGASLHGALAQSEAYRLEATAARLASELAKMIGPIRTVLNAPDPLAGVAVLRAAVLNAVELIMDEHDDWHMLVRPHHLPLG